MCARVRVFAVSDTSGFSTMMSEAVSVGISLHDLLCTASVCTVH